MKFATRDAIDEKLIEQRDEAAVFATYDADYGIVPEPRPASEFVPEWVDSSVPDSVLNALNEGWILRMYARAEINAEAEGQGVEWETNFDRDVVSLHAPGQMEGFSVPISITKFHSYWTVRLPDGYSALLTAPLSRPNPLFTPFSGCVDFDVFPTVTHCPNLFEERTHAVIPEGTPIFQCIPFERDSLPRTATTRTATDDELAEMEAENPSETPRLTRVDVELT